MSSLPRPPGLGEVQFKVDREDERSAVYIIEGEDHTIGNLLEKLLLETNGVDFANYEMPHPLEHKIVLRIRTDGSISPREALREALERALKLIDEFRELYLKELERLGREIET